MITKVSSALTPAYKFLFTGSFAAAATVALYAGIADHNDDAVGIGILFVGVSALLCASLGRFKGVSMDDQNLYISNWLRTVNTPIHNVASVRVSTFIQPRIAVVRLHHPTDMGQIIRFIPRGAGFLGKAREVEELQRRAKLLPALSSDRDDRQSK